MANRIIPWMMDHSGCLIGISCLRLSERLSAQDRRKAGVTTGAIYTRYKNKDALFASLLQDFFETMQVLFAPIAEEYEKAKCSAQPDDILRAINAEEQVYFQLLTEHCNDCTLFFCRSDGSSMETVLHKLMDQKAEQTVEFFRISMGSAKCRCDPSFDGLTVLVLPPAAGSAYGGRQNAYLLTGSP